MHQHGAKSSTKIPLNDRDARNARPPDLASVLSCTPDNPTPRERTLSKFDCIVIGAGPGGYVAAIHAAQLGKKVAIIEKDKALGGTCLNRGCIPTKALLEAAHLRDKLKHAKRFGIKVAGVEVDWPGVQRYRKKVVKQNTAGVSYLMKKNEITVYHGHGRFIGGSSVKVTAQDGATEILEAGGIILATGSRCKDFPFARVDGKRIINSDQLLELDTIPKRLLVLGAGAVGTEFASIYNSFGSKVTIIEVADRLLPIEDHEISRELEKAFARRKIKCLTSHKVSSVTNEGEVVKVEVDGPDGERSTLEAEYFLVAAGRAPVSDDVGLDATKIVLNDDGTIEVDELCKTSEPGVYAIGDLIQTPWLAHLASHEGILAVDHMLGREVHPIDLNQVPSCTYCDPEVASIGLTEQAAKEAGYDVRVGTFPFSANPRARIMQESEGLIKIVTDAEYGEVLGMHIMGAKATELIVEGGMALRLEATVEEITKTIHAHPTLGEALGEAAHAVFGQAIHM